LNWVIDHQWTSIIYSWIFEKCFYINQTHAVVFDRRSAYVWQQQLGK